MGKSVSRIENSMSKINDYKIANLIYRINCKFGREIEDHNCLISIIDFFEKLII